MKSGDEVTGGVDPVVVAAIVGVVPINRWYVGVGEGGKWGGGRGVRCEGGGLGYILSLSDD